MRRFLGLLVLICLPLSCGCTYDTAFRLFGDHYTDGTTRADKQTRFNSQVEKYQ
jgi:hypothetical protein